METTIDEVMIEIDSNSDSAGAGLDNLKNSIDKLYSSLDMTLNKLGKFNSALTNMQSKAQSSSAFNLGSSPNLNVNTPDIKTSGYDKLTTKTQQISNSTSQAREKVSSLISAFGRVGRTVISVSDKIGKMINFFSKGTKKIKDGFDSIIHKSNKFFDGNRVTSGLKKLMKYAFALFSIRGTYALLNSAAKRWLSSSSAAAQQLSANIDYLKFAAGSALAPVIEYLVNLVYSLLRGIQKVAYALTGVNIFAKATASSMASTAKSAKEAAKSLAPFDELNVIDFGNNSGSGDGGVAPSLDLSSVDAQMSPFAQKLYDFFKPLKESWDIYGPDLIEQIKTTASQVTYLISSVWKSFENIITNGTVYYGLELILQIIGNIAEAFSNAWNYNGNGNAIIQNLANAFNNLLVAINNVVKSEGFQKFLDFVSDKFREISEKIASINWQPLIDALAQIGGAIGVIALNILSGLVDVLKWFIEHPEVAKAILAIYLGFKAFSGLQGIIEIISAIKMAFEVIAASPIVTMLLGIVTVVTGAIIGISNFFSMLQEGFSWVKEVLMLLGIAIIAVGAIILGAPALVAGIIAAIVAVIATLIVVIKDNWKAICNFISAIPGWINDNIIQPIVNFFVWLWNTIVEGVQSIWNTIVSIFSAVAGWINGNVIQPVINFFTGLWNGIVNGVQSVWNSITSIFGRVANWIYSNVVSPIINFFNQAWNFIAGGISGIIKGAINGALSAAEKVINFFIRGINGVISIINAIPRSKYIKNNIIIIT